MTSHARISSPGDRDGITDLMHRAFAAGLNPTAIDPAFQRWKYWDEHPYAAGGRSYVIDGQERIVAHACQWPMRVASTGGVFDAFHLIDWAADTGHTGAGMVALRESVERSAALFSIGGSDATRRLLPALGQYLKRHLSRGKSLCYQVSGKVYFLSRPLNAVAAAFRESPLGWKTPARLAKNALYAAVSRPKLPAEITFEQVQPEAIPGELWPAPTADYAVSLRSPKLLAHFEECPVLQRPMFFVVNRNGRPLAYFFLTLAGSQVRLADYGPAGLRPEDAKWVGIAAQLAAKQHYADSARIAAATSEVDMRAGLIEAGFHDTFAEEIRGLIVDPSLVAIRQYRLTYLDLDALCL